MTSRKLQTEIDKTLKKVAEGIEYFDEIIDKLHGPITNNQKEKYELDLKKEIKKLQRFRDQIKAWLSSSEIKDKAALTETRRLIELQMEKFKVCEKEMKTKAYSKEGLNQAAKIDPKEKEKHEMTFWLSQTVDTIKTQIDAYEAEIESLVLAIKKTKKADPAKLEKKDGLEARVLKHKAHVDKIEILLRMLENDKIHVDDLVPLKDNLAYYVESNQEPDFVEDEEMYDEFDMIESGSDDGDSDSSDDEKKQEASQPIISPKLPVVEKEAIARKAHKPPSVIPAKKQETVPVPPKATEKKEPHRKEELSFSEVLAGGKDKDLSFAHVAAQKPATVPAAEGEVKKDLSFDALRQAFEALRSAEGNDPVYVQQALENSFVNIPDSSDIDRQRYTPKSPFPAPNYYPANPPSIFENPSVFERFDIDTLFFIFYYQQKTLQQYFSARELKRQSWRFHKKYLTWFQRYEEPKIITDEYEQGTYIYFDYEGSWCQRKKSEFTFEYRYLEDAELV